MKKTHLIVFTLLTFASCKKESKTTNTTGSSSTIEYSFTSANNENCSGYYWDTDGKQQSIIDIRGGWTKTVEAKSGNTAHLTLSSNYAGKIIGIIKLNGTIVASDTDQNKCSVQYFIK